ncbi:penicillin-binding protein [Candidatus Gracilibacteria bacterium]|nr:penicillin-binding protein [Candidatus Gracilibacteria bacterium]
MAFQKRRVAAVTPSSYRNRNYKKIKTSTQSGGGVKKPKKPIGKTLLYIIGGLFIFGLIGIIVLYQKIIAPLPSISELENLEISESSTIYDREGGELYSIFQEKRRYVTFDAINKNMINAIVAGEDKRYWENPGVDFIGLVRAGIYGVIGKNEGFGGTSTLTQQLIRNTIIENRSSDETVFDKVERKIKEIYLAFKLTNGVSKEKILELYLNKIAYGSNAYGIEQASKTFYGKSAKDLGILEASMLASLPKGPTYYSPYNNFDRLVGYPYVYENNDSENSIFVISKNSIEENKDAVTALTDFLDGLKAQRFDGTKALLCGLKEENLKSNISIDGDGCSVISYTDFLTLLNNIKIEVGDKNVEYQIGRKDFILGRMLEDEYITFEEYKDAVIGGIGFEFQKYTEDIKSPHFVFYVREYLEEKYGKDLLETGGLKIYTSLDPKLQEEAERIVSERAAANETKFGAQNAALVSLDNKTGQILAMVGGRDYFDEKNKGNINMTTAALQPGSSFKPFVYALAIDQGEIGTKTPIYDLKTTFPGDYTPKNYDGKFMGKMTISTALNYSRNIPAVKMFFLAGGEENILTFMEKLGIDGIRKFRDEYTASSGTKYTYGASMALGTVMMTPLEMAQAYSVFANLGVKRELVPVIKILDSKGLVIEEAEENNGVQAIDAATAYILDYILSDTSARPSGWNNYLSLSGRNVAAKTGTSTKASSKDGNEVLARNLWTIGFTPQITTVVWAGNNDGSETGTNGNGLEAAGSIWKEFMESAHVGKEVLNWKRPNGVKEANISRISGLLAPGSLDSSLILSSLFKNAPTEFDQSLQPIEVDLLCNGTITENTPASAIGTVNLLALRSLQPNNPAWENPVRAWVNGGGYTSEIGNVGSFITYINPEACERTGFAGNISVGANIESGATFVNGSNYIEIAYQSSTPITQIDVFLGEKKIKQIDLDSKKEGVYKGDVTIPSGTLGIESLIVKATDTEYYSQSKSYSIDVIKRDNAAPEITVSNPSNGKISLYAGDFFNLRGSVSDISVIRSVNIYIDDKPYKIGIQGRDFAQEIDSSEIEIGEHVIKVEAVDMDFNIGSQSIQLDVLER